MSKHKHSFLIIDDNRDYAEALSRIISHAGCDVNYLDDMGAAYNLCQKTMPCVVLLDLNMAQKSALDICASLRDLPKGKDVMIAGITNDPLDKIKDTDDFAMFDGLFRKPIENEVLKGMVDKICKE